MFRAANLDLETRPGGRGGGTDERGRDVACYRPTAPIEPLRISPTTRAVEPNRIALAGRRAAFHHKAGDARVIAGGELLGERFASDELRLVELDRPASSRLAPA